MGMLSEGLGLDIDKLKNTTCLDSRLIVGHYYPCCPQLDLTVGLASHTNPRVLSVLLQDHIGGLQIKHEREVKILRSLTGHNNLVKFYDAFEDHDNVYIVMELCEGGVVHRDLKP